MRVINRIVISLLCMVEGCRAKAQTWNHDKSMPIQYVVFSFS